MQKFRILSTHNTPIHILAPSLSHKPSPPSLTHWIHTFALEFSSRFPQASIIIQSPAGIRITMAHENSISSININTHRGIPPKTHGIRSNGPTDPRFNPTAPAFVRKASTEDNFTSSGVVEPSIKYDAVGYMHELHGHSYGKSRQDPIKHDRGREYLSHWHNPNPLSGTSRLPPPSMGAPSTVSSSRSRSSTIQYSPPCRPYHNAVIPSPMQGGYQAKVETSNAETFDTRLEYLQNLKKELLAAFKEYSKTLIDLTTCPDDLCRSWQRSDANNRLAELYRRDGDAGNTEKLRDELGQGVKNVEEEIEEMWGDFKVPGEARAEEEIRFWNWKDEVSYQRDEN